MNRSTGAMTRLGATAMIAGIVAIFAAALTLTLTSGAHAAPMRSEGDDGLRAKGLINSMPEGTLFGAWVISGETYQAMTGTTQFRQEYGMLAIGKCAEVEYVMQGATRLAKRIGTDDSCAGRGDDDDDHEDDDRYGREIKGQIESFPAELIGEWRVSGQTYSATASTHFEQDDGPFAVGQCVEIKTAISSTVALSIDSEDSCIGEHSHLSRTTGILNAYPVSTTGLLGTWTVNTNTYEVVTSTALNTQHGEFFVGACVRVYFDGTTPGRTAHRVETKSLDDCAPRTPMTPTIEARGVITSRPPTDTLFGTWNIGGFDYSAISGTTRFKFEHGPLLAGDCAKVKYYAQGGARIATRIESEEEHGCGNEREQREAHGAINALPDGGLIGVWQIGERSYVVSTTTELRGPFAIGTIVEVKFTRAADGSLLATRIKAKSIFEDDRRGGKTNGIINERPLSPTVVGTWVIASNTYTVTAGTRLTGTLQVGDCAEVYYRIENGGRVAKRIKTESSDDCARDGAGKPINETYGFVTDMPSSGFIGTWVVGGATYESNATTEFNAKGGTIMVGSFVEVKYVLKEGVRVAIEIEIHLPPNSGDDSRFGTVSIDGSGNMSVDGTPIVITPSSLVDDSQGELKDGAKVYVNSASASPAAQSSAAAARPITKLIVVAQITRTYLPAVSRQ